MKIVSPEQMSAIDACAINEYGIPGLLLMENAAVAVVSEAVSMMGGCRGRQATVVAGRGNNGGDAFAAARLLHNRGACVRVYLTGPKKGISGDALINMAILERIGVDIFELVDDKDIEVLCADIEKSHLIIDGIFGTGLGRKVEGLAGSVIDSMNRSGKPILAIDIPSGVDGSDGGVSGICVKASTTVTFTVPKRGLVQSPGCEYTGSLVVADIGIPDCVTGGQDIRTELIDAQLVSGLIPARRPESNKGDYGKVLIVTGSTGMTGSGCLASMAALRTGAGLVYVGVPRSLAGVYGTALAEPIVLPLEDNEMGYLATESAQQILAHMKGMDVAAIGPGLTVSESVRRVVERVIVNSRLPLVLDADALNSISGNTGILKKLCENTVITPHPGEMARLTGLGTDEIQRDRAGTAERFAAEYGVITVLKGNRTVVATPDGRVYINPAGNAGMATAGAGDVLTGIIAGLYAQGVPMDGAAVAGVYLHGLAGDAAAENMGMHGMLASDITGHLPFAIKEMLKLRT